MCCDVKRRMSFNDLSTVRRRLHDLYIKMSNSNSRDGVRPQGLTFSQGGGLRLISLVYTHDLYVSTLRLIRSHL